MRTINSYIWSLMTLCLLVGFSGCDMEQEVEIKLPKLPNQLVVECYLEDGQPIKMALSESSGYFDAAQPVVVDDAKVTITKNNEPPMELTFRLEVNRKTQKIFTHHSARAISGKPGDVFKLVITDPRGRRLTGTTTVLPKVPIDSVGWKFNDKPRESQEAYIMVRFQDIPGQKNFYRLLVHKTDTSGVNSLLDRELTDELSDGKKITYFSTYRFGHNDTLTVKLYHAEEAYFRFVSSVEDARRANGNPFAQPVVVQSTVAGGFGVFTFLNYTTKDVIIK